MVLKLSFVAKYSRVLPHFDKKLHNIDAKPYGIWFGLHKVETRRLENSFLGEK